MGNKPNYKRSLFTRYLHKRGSQTEDTVIGPEKHGLSTIQVPTWLKQSFKILTVDLFLQAAGHVYVEGLQEAGSG